MDPALSCGLGLLSIQGRKPAELYGRLWEKYRIITTPIEHPQFSGLRITPNIYTTIGEIDRFCGAVEELLA